MYTYILNVCVQGIFKIWKSDKENKNIKQVKNVYLTY